jgi:hypothetical protein
MYWQVTCGRVLLVQIFVPHIITVAPSVVDLDAAYDVFNWLCTLDLI